MNKFGTRQMQHLIDEARSASMDEKRPDADRRLFASIADTLEAADRYYGAVEAACA